MAESDYKWRSAKLWDCVVRAANIYGVEAHHHDTAYYSLTLEYVDDNQEKLGIIEVTVRARYQREPASDNLIIGRTRILGDDPHTPLEIRRLAAGLVSIANALRTIKTRYPNLIVGRPRDTEGNE